MNLPRDPTTYGVKSCAMSLRSHDVLLCRFGVTGKTCSVSNSCCKPSKSTILPTGFRVLKNLMVFLWLP